MTPIEAMANEGLIKEAITSYKISRAADKENDGQITFGGLDDTHFDGDSLVTLDNVSEEGFWEANIGALSVDGVNMKLEARTAILDTGTTVILAPSEDAKKIHAAIEGAKSDGHGGFTVPCMTTASVALTFGNTLFAIDPRDLAIEPVDADDPTGDCVSGIVADTEHTDGPRQWLVGDHSESSISCPHAYPICSLEMFSSRTPIFRLMRAIIKFHSPNLFRELFNLFGLLE